MSEERETLGAITLIFFNFEVFFVCHFEMFVSA